MDDKSSNIHPRSVSHEEQVMHGLSLDAQRETLTAYAKAHNMQVVDYYVDEGITARKKIQNRKEFQRLLADIKQDKIDLVLVTKLDRWFRNIKDYHNTQEVLEQHGCNWKTVLEDYDTSTAAGRLHINIMLSVNQDESDRTSERIKAVFKHKVANGEIISGTLPYGYTKRDKRLVIDDEQAAVVKAIYDYYERHNNLRQTAIWVNNTHTKMLDDTIRAMLRNPFYKGEHPSGVKDFCPPIIAASQWDNVQRLLKINQKRYQQTGEPSTYIFSGMVRCKVCGHNMTGGRNKYKGKPYKYYRCGYYYKHKICTNCYTVPESGILEKYLIGNVQRELKRYAVSFEVSQKESKQKDNSAQIAKVRKRIEKLKDLYLDDLIEKDVYKRDYEELTVQLQGLTSASNAYKADTAALKSVMQFDFENMYASLTDSEKRYIWQSVIEYIEVGTSRDDITIHFR